MEPFLSEGSEGEVYSSITWKYLSKVQIAEDLLEKMYFFRKVAKAELVMENSDLKVVILLAHILQPPSTACWLESAVGKIV